MPLAALDSVASIDPISAKAHGRYAIGRYLTGNNPLSRSELETYTAHGFYVFALFEVGTDDVQGGEAAGTAHAHAALQALDALKVPKGIAVTIFFACDEDPAGLPGGPKGAIPYYRGTAAVRTAGHRNGAYIGAKGANALLGAGVVDRIMLPNATSWQDDTVPEREDVVQGYPYVTIGGSQYDPDTVHTLDVLWNLHGNYAQPHHPQGEEVNWTTLKPGDSGQKVHALQGSLKGISRFPHEINGHFGAQTEEAVKEVQKAHHLPVTGEVDGHTLLAIFGEA